MRRRLKRILISEIELAETVVKYLRKEKWEVQEIKNLIKELSE